MREGSVNRWVGWIRYPPMAEGLSRHWKRVTKPLPLEHVLDLLSRYRGGDGGKVALPEGETPTLSQENDAA